MQLFTPHLGVEINYTQEFWKRKFEEFVLAVCA